jgi:hypothetical protein
LTAADHALSAGAGTADRAQKCATAIASSPVAQVKRKESPVHGYSNRPAADRTSRRPPLAPTLHASIASGQAQGSARGGRLLVRSAAGRLLYPWTGDSFLLTCATGDDAIAVAHFCARSAVPAPALSAWSAAVKRRAGLLGWTVVAGVVAESRLRATESLRRRGA